MFQELVTNNRSYRRFKQNLRISLDELKELVSLARLAPSAANLQALRFFLVYEPQRCADLFPHLRWAGYLRYWDGPSEGERPAAYIIILAPRATNDHHQIDVGITAQTIMLGASEKGIGGCMFASMDKEAIHQCFELPEELEVKLILALGYPAEKVIIEEMDDPDDVEYWRDDDGCHHVPKRKLEDLILN